MKFKIPFLNRDPPTINYPSHESFDTDLVPEAVIEEAPKPRRWRDDHNAYGNALTKRGFQLIGQGYYSAVYGKEGSDKVIKVGRDPEGDGWLDYIHWATQKGHLGKFAPRVFSYKFHRGKNEYDPHMGKWNQSSFYVAVVERLDKRARDLDKRSPVRALPNVIEMANNELIGEVLDRLSPGLASFTQDFLNEFEKNAGVDIHGDNIMLRKNGDIVLNDPLSSRQRRYKSRRKAQDFMLAA